MPSCDKHLVTDGLAKQGAMASTSNVVTQLSQNIPVSPPDMSMIEKLGSILWAEWYMYGTTFRTFYKKQSKAGLNDCAYVHAGAHLYSHTNAFVIIIQLHTSSGFKFRQNHKLVELQHEIANPIFLRSLLYLCLNYSVTNWRVSVRSDIFYDNTSKLKLWGQLMRSKQVIVYWNGQYQPWFSMQFNQKRLQCMLELTKPQGK